MIFTFVAFISGLLVFWLYKKISTPKPKFRDNYKLTPMFIRRTLLFSFDAGVISHKHNLTFVRDLIKLLDDSLASGDYVKSAKIMSSIARTISLEF